MFLQCKQLYKFFYLDDIKDHYVTPKPPIVMGEHVHRALDDFYAIPKSERTEKTLHDLLRKSWIRNRGCFGEQEKMWGEKALKMLSMYFLEHKADDDPLYREQYVDTSLGSDLVLLGKVDRIDSSGNDDTLQVIDYKTGKEKDRTHQDTLQLLLYSLLVQQKYKKPVEKASFWYLGTGQEQSIHPTDDDLQAAVIEVEEIAATVNSEEEFLPSPNQFCKNCDFRDICSAYVEE